MLVSRFHLCPACPIRVALIARSCLSFYLIALTYSLRRSDLLYPPM